MNFLYRTNALEALELSFKSMGLFVGSWSLRYYNGCFAYDIKNFFSTRGACSELVSEFERRETYFGSLRACPCHSQHNLGGGAL
jgi:hypothetical protein